MGCGFSKFGATTDGEVGSTLRIKSTKPPLEKIVERSRKWRINEQRGGGHRRDNSLSQKFLEDSSSEDQQAGLDDDGLIVPQTQSKSSPAGVERKVQNESGKNNEEPRDEEGKGEERSGIREEVGVVDTHRHSRRDRDETVVGDKSNDNAANGSYVGRNGGDERDEHEEEEEDHYSDDRQDSITFQFQGSPSFKEYCIVANDHDDNGNYEEEEEEGRRGKKVEKNGKIVSTTTKSMKINNNNEC